MTALALPSARPETSQATQVEQSRAIAEVQAAVVVAQQCPRDMARAEGEMREACGRLALAQRAFYRVPKRGEGPSVHLARELARIWGNVSYGVKELRRDDRAGISEILAYAWDVQTNTRSERTFVVPHQRMVAGERKALVDLGDVYLNNQNVGARAVRECIFTVLPTWYVEVAQEICAAALKNGDGRPLKDRIADMVAAFSASYGVSAAQIEGRLGRKRGQWDHGDVATMIVTFESLKRGETTVPDEFPSARATVADFVAKSTPQTDGGEYPVEDAASPPLTSEEQGIPEPDSPPSPITAAQMKALHAGLNAAGLSDRASGLAYISEEVGRTVETSKDLTRDEASKVIDALHRLALPQPEEPLQWVEES